MGCGDGGSGENFVFGIPDDSGNAGSGYLRINDMQKRYAANEKHKSSEHKQLVFSSGKETTLRDFYKLPGH
jgi:hypothetical protein